MIKITLLSISILFLLSCSFDDKTGIWQDSKNDNKISLKSKNLKREKVFKENEFFEKEVKNNLDINIISEKENFIWENEYFNSQNNFKNFKLKKFDNESFIKEKHNLKLSGKLLINRNVIISNDEKANVIVYSITDKKILMKYNFYKKKFKKYKKKLYLVLDVKNNSVIAADNLGYVYSLNINTKKINWANNFGIPFRSEIKIIKDQIFLSNQDNILYSIDSQTGKKNWQLLTETTNLNSSFKNSIVANNKSLFYLNSSGKLYSINHLNKKINWISSFSESMSDNKFGFFDGQPITLYNEKLILSSFNQIHLIDYLTGKTIWSRSIKNTIKPLVINEQIFLITKNRFLVSLNFNGKVNWSRNINQMIKNDNQVKINNLGQIKNLSFINSNIQTITSKGYVIDFKIKNGDIKNIYGLLKEKIYYNPIYANSKIYVLNKAGKLLIYH